MTPTAVGLVLVNGHEADGEIMDQDAFDVPTRRGATAISTSEYVASAMSRTRAISDGRRPHTIGVTWSDDSELEASLLLTSLTDAGFDNIVAVRSPEAGEALARGIGRAVGYEQTAVCLLEPDAVLVSMVDTYDGAVQTVAHQEPVTADSLIGWLTTVFDQNDWHPECMILVGPDADLDALARRLEHALTIPVFAPAEAELALARGAALASAQSPEATFDDYRRSPEGGHRARRRSWPPYTAALTMLVVGIATFVVSVSLAAGQRLTSDTGSITPPTTQRPVVTPDRPSAVAEAVPPPAAPRSVEVAPPPPVREAPPSAIPNVEEQVSPPADVTSAVPEQAPAVVDPVAETAPPPTDVPPAPAPEVASAVPPVQGSKPPLMTRILGHIPGLNRDPQPPAAPAVPPETPPPPP